LFDAVSIGLVLDLSPKKLKLYKKEIIEGLRTSEYGDRFYLYGIDSEEDRTTSLGKCISLINAYTPMDFIPWQAITYTQLMVAHELYCNRHVIYFFDKYKYKNKAALLKPVTLDIKTRSGIKFHYVYLGDKPDEFEELRDNYYLGLNLKYYENPDIKEIVSNIFKEKTNGCED
jgi:hypothetical protein